MSTQTDRRGSKSSYVRPGLGSMEEITWDVESPPQRRRSSGKESSKFRRESSQQKSAKRGSMQPIDKEKKISLAETSDSTGDNYCDMLIRRINGGNTNKLEEVYTLKEKIGEGAFAKVYRAVHKESGKKYALKIISLDTTEFEKQVAEKNILGRNENDVAKRRAKMVIKKLTILLKSVDTEVYIMKKVAEFTNKELKSLVKVHEIMANKVQVVFVMELLYGGELFERISEKGEYTETDAAYVMRKVMRGIRALHANGICHRDLKPENIVYETEEEDSKIKITDFGLAFKVGEKDIFDSTIVGSPSYIAPEILTHKLYSYAGDIWAMGCILFILLVGGPPFSGDNNETLFESIKQGKYSFPEECELSDSAKDLIARMLTTDPSKRLTAVQVLKHSWINKKAQSAQLKHTFNHLNTFNARRKLKKWALGMVANSKNGVARLINEVLLNTSLEDGFSGIQLISLRDLWFRQADEKDRIIFEDFHVCFEKIGVLDIPTKKLFDIFANNKDTCLVADLCIGLSTVCKNWKGEDVLRYCFETYDRNNTGRISKDDVRKILKVVVGEEKAYDKVTGGMNSILNSLLRKTKEVSFEEFSNAVIRNGGDWDVKQKILDPMATLVKNLSKVGFKQMSRIGSNVSIASTNMKRSMTRLNVNMSFEDASLFRAAHRKSAGRIKKGRDGSFISRGTLVSDPESIDINDLLSKNEGTLPRVFVTRDRKRSLRSNLLAQSPGSGRMSKKVVKKKQRGRFLTFTSKSRPKSKKTNPRTSAGRNSKSKMTERNSRGSFDPSNRKSARRAYLIRRVPNTNVTPKSNLYKPDEVCEQEYDVQVEWGNLEEDRAEVGIDLNAIDLNPRTSLMIRMKHKFAKSIKEKSNITLISQNSDDTDCDSDNL